MVKKAVRRGRSERRGESYCEPYGEPLSDARTKLEGFFTILLGVNRVGLAGDLTQRSRRD